MERVTKKKATPKLFIADQRMLELMKHIVSVNLKDVTTQQDFCEAIGILKGGIAPIRKGERHFTTAQILNACRYFNVDVNWLFGFTENMFRSQDKTALELLKEAVIAVDTAYGPKTNTNARAYNKKK
ncbi:helix-turn-helix transcriptional regulator [Taibaiella lutea]|uniref:Helix-turn-helix transcriptional regulator n=1 Tax=Taibaiella lutea TaxID=2608001 RepID=A0A5M6CCB7_9BACT|nr:helix-turn-helix transcriptional regulator [Taibaiella lutea]KAA5532701.1 helix-turn-helix transcriptional regulator [Taibaiella lutea]